MFVLFISCRAGLLARCQEEWSRLRERSAGPPGAQYLFHYQRGGILPAGPFDGHHWLSGLQNRYGRRSEER